MTVKRVCVIGGGPAGLASVKALNLEPESFKIDLFELKPQFGGVWNYCSTKSKYITDEQIKKADVDDYSPIYKYLETNILPELMAFSNVSFDIEGTFPTHKEVLEYLLKYSKTIGKIDNTYFNTKVVSVKKIGTEWEVIGKKRDGTIIKDYYETVILSNGHFYKPYFPEIPGLEEWRSKDPNTLTHAKYFDDAKHYTDKKVLLIGGFTSGSDLALHLSQYASKIYVSVKPGQEIPGGLDKYNPYVELRPQVVGVDYSQKAVTFINGDTLKVDVVISCAGYFYHTPFLKEIYICKGHYIDELYKQIFWYKDPSLIFPGLLRNVNPFPMIELQASVIGRVVSGRLELPDLDSRYESYKQEIQVTGSGKEFHNYMKPKEFDYTTYWQSLIKDQGLLDGLNSPVYEGRRYDLRVISPETKLERIRAASDAIVGKRAEPERSEGEESSSEAKVQ